LTLLTPLESTHSIDPCGHCSTTDSSGVFIGT
jgi:hypothetical protein